MRLVCARSTGDAQRGNGLSTSRSAALVRLCSASRLLNNARSTVVRCEQMATIPTSPRAMARLTTLPAAGMFRPELCVGPPSSRRRPRPSQHSSRKSQRVVVIPSPIIFPPPSSPTTAPRPVPAPSAPHRLAIPARLGRCQPSNRLRIQSSAAPHQLPASPSDDPKARPALRLPVRLLPCTLLLLAPPACHILSHLSHISSSGSAHPYASSAQPTSARTLLGLTPRSTVQPPVAHLPAPRCDRLTAPVTQPPAHPVPVSASGIAPKHVFLIGRLHSSGNFPPTVSRLRSRFVCESQHCALEIWRRGLRRTGPADEIGSHH